LNCEGPSSKKPDIPDAAVSSEVCQRRLADARRAAGTCGQSPGLSRAVEVSIATPVLCHTLKTGQAHTKQSGRTERFDPEPCSLPTL